jgi:hypothetical protein
MIRLIWQGEEGQHLYIPYQEEGKGAEKGAESDKGEFDIVNS